MNEGRALTDERGRERKSDGGRDLAQLLSALHRLTLELARCTDFDQLCRMAVQNARECLPVDRLSIWLKESDQSSRGTYGIDENGVMRDERESRVTMGPETAMYRVMNDRTPLVVLQDSPLRDNRGEIIGYGTHLVAALMTDEEVVGCLCADNYLSGQDFTAEQREVLTLFASALGTLVSRSYIERIRRESERRLRMTLNAAGAMVWTWRLDTDTIEATEQAQRLFGRSSGPRSDFLARVHPEDRQKFPTKENVEQALSGSDEFRVLTPGGETRWLSRKVFIERDADGGPVAVDGVYTDITDRKRAEQALWHNIQRLNMALETANLGVWYIDMTDGRRFWSRRTREHFGISSTIEVTTQLVDSLIHPDERESVRIALNRSLATGEPYNQLLRVLAPDGSERWIKSSGIVSKDDSGRFISLDGITLDFTAQVEAEKQLERRVRERTSELTAANQEMEGFTYTVSHDLRAPLRAITSASMILLSDYGDNLPDEAKDQLRRQAAAAKRMAALIDDLLKLSRLSREQITRERFDMSKLVREVAEEVFPQFEPEPKLSVQEEVFADGDVRLIRFAIQNLLENACKFAKPEGAVIEFGADSQGFFVRDRGIGFDPQYAHRIFEPFERLHGQGRYPGTGIGLANVKRIVERHGGSVWAEGVPGEGATFHFTL